MHPSILAVVAAAMLTLASAQSTTEPITGVRGNATIVVNNPVGKVYVAVLPEQEWNNPQDPRGNVKGSISATANPDGIGVSFAVKFENLPTSGGPFLYHIHDAPVPADGNCTTTLAHADPYIRGETSACDASLPQTCQTGDLSGKHGKITQDPFVASYSDGFASTLEGIGAFFGNRSFVIHFANKTRITCANFALEATNTSTPTTLPTGSPNTTTTPVPFTGAAAVNAGTVSLTFLTSAFGLLFML
ncbi:superoxide dismutase [Diplocarpon rosae]|nr:superoxide dismutase [Diplocarpon rosae]